MLGGSANGDLLSVGPETGELTDVASAKRAVRTPFCEDDEDELEPVLVDLVVIEGAFFSEESTKATGCGALFPLTISTGETGSSEWFCWWRGIDIAIPAEPVFRVRLADVR